MGETATESREGIRSVAKSTADAVARAVLYEGFVLYPYRSSSLKNRHRWLFGSLAPRPNVERSRMEGSGGHPSRMQIECLLRGPGDASVRVCVRFLHLLRAGTGDQPELGADAIEREFVVDTATVDELRRRPRECTFAFGPQEVGAEEAGAWMAEAIQGRVRVVARDVGERAFALGVEIENTTACPPGRDASAHSLASAHALVETAGAEFCSLADPPADLASRAAQCVNVGAWPALLNPRAVLASAIILPDFPSVAAESPGDLFDATEIDEILTLRILALTDGEKEEVRRAGGPARALLDRTEALGPGDLSRLHGALRGRPAGRVRPGDRVRLVPRARGDVMDIALARRRATVVAVEEDFEGGTHVVVTVDDDPGADLGRSGLPGHRFFFHPDEVEPWT